MPALSVVDLAMFALETADRPFNIGPLVVLSPPASVRGSFADKLVARMLRRPMGPPFNYRLETPLGAVPYLAVDEQADAAEHVHRLTLDAPGTMHQLCETVCKLHETRLDRTRPLWELYVIDGLADGKCAVYGKVHHGIIDGRTFVEVVANWLAPTATEKTVRAMWEGVSRKPQARHAPASLGDSAMRAMRRVAGTTASAVGLARMLSKQALTTVGLADGMTLPMLNVPAAFDGKVGAERSFAFCTLPIDEVKAVAKASGATVNDVLLVILDIAMARDLSERGMLPDRPLVADMPLALQDATGGNQIAVMQFPLGASNLSPLDRIEAIRRHAGHVKEVVRRETADTVMLYTTIVHGLPALLERIGVKRGLPISNALVSNPFGMREERYLMGAHAELVLPVSVVAAGQMLNITAVTLADKLQIGFLAIPHAVPDVEKLAAYAVDAFDELKEATRARAEPPAKARKRSAPGSRASSGTRRSVGRAARTA